MRRAYTWGMEEEGSAEEKERERERRERKKIENNRVAQFISERETTRSKSI